MPDIVSLLLFLCVIFGAAIVAFFLQRAHTKINRLTETNVTLSDHITLLKNQLTLVSRTYQDGHHSSETDEILNQSNTGFLLLSEQGTVLWMNPYTADLLSIQATQHLTEPFSNVVTIINEKQQSLIHLLSEAQTGKPVVLPRWTFIKTEQKSIPVAGEFIPFTSQNGLRQILFLFVDGQEEYLRLWQTDRDAVDVRTKLTSTLHELSQLRLTQDISSKLINTMNIAIIIFSPDGTIHQVNSYVEQFLGKFRSEMIGKPYRDSMILKNQQDQIDYSPVESALQGKPGELPQWTFMTTKNGKKAVRGSFVSLSDASGTSFIVLYFLDASGQYAAEAEEKAFISSAAHDLRAPLTTIRGVTELLETSLASMQPDQVKEMITGAKESSIHVIDLVNDLLEVSRLDQNRVTVKKTAFDITAVARSTVLNMQYLAKEKHLYLNFELSDNALPFVTGDESKTVDILTNLLSNAIKYTQNGGVTVRQTSQEGRVITTVEDTGTGISNQNIPLLFHKFQQVGESRYQPKTKSTGLGLYIAKKFALLMGGDIRLVKSEPEQGSIFEFTLPVAPHV